MSKMQVKTQVYGLLITNDQGVLDVKREVVAAISSGWLTGLRRSTPHQWCSGSSTDCWYTVRPPPRNNDFIPISSSNFPITYSKASDLVLV